MGTARQTSAAEDQNQTSAGAVRRQTTFLTEIRIDFGPPQLLGQFFLRADAVVRQRGIRLEFAPITELVDLNRANKASWGVFAQTLDSRYTDISAASSYCLLGRNEVGEVVAAQAGRLYSLRDRSLQDIADDASLYYGDRKPDVGGISCRMTAPWPRTS